MKSAHFSSDLFGGRTVFITGAGRGIGLAVAREFAACGARVVAHAGRERGTSLDGVAEIVLTADLTQPGEASLLAAQVKERCESIDVLVNNAGTMFGRFPAAELTDADYESLVMLNQSAVVTLTRDLLPVMRKASDAAIVNTVSISARTGGSPGSSVYSATKAFVATYTRALARELGPEGIRANAVSPGTIGTEFHDRYSSPEKLAATAKSVPLGRIGTAEDCVGAYLFLASPAAAYITGQVIEVNGGQAMP